MFGLPKKNEIALLIETARDIRNTMVVISKRVQINTATVLKCTEVLEATQKVMKNEITSMLNNKILYEMAKKIIEKKEEEKKNAEKQTKIPFEEKKGPETENV